jgi:hypothetical protein
MSQTIGFDLLAFYLHNKYKDEFNKKYEKGLKMR